MLLSVCSSDRMQTVDQTVIVILLITTQVCVTALFIRDILNLRIDTSQYILILKNFFTSTSLVV
jgi:hypothetical protein